MFNIGEEVYLVFCLKDLKFLKFRLERYKNEPNIHEYNSLLEEFQRECLNSSIYKDRINSVRLETDREGNIIFIYSFEKDENFNCTVELIFKTYEEAKTYAETHLKKLYEEYKVLLNEPETKQENILKVEPEHKNSFFIRSTYITIIFLGIVFVSYILWKSFT